MPVRASEPDPIPPLVSGDTNCLFDVAPVAAKAPVTPPVTSAVAPMAPPVKSVRTVRIQTKATPEEIAEAVRRGWRPTDQHPSGSRLALAPVARCELLWAPVAAGALVAAGAPAAPDAGRACAALSA